MRSHGVVRRVTDLRRAPNTGSHRLGREGDRKCTFPDSSCGLSKGRMEDGEETRVTAELGNPVCRNLVPEWAVALCWFQNSLPTCFCVLVAVDQEVG